MNKYGVVGETTADITHRGFRWTHPAVLAVIYAFIFGASIAFAGVYFPREPDMRLVIIESPYAGDIESNTRYARRALLDCLKRGEAPLASHLLYTQVLDDGDPEQRRLGIRAGLRWGKQAEASVVYIDRGISVGMRHGIDRALNEGRPVIYRMGLAEGPIAVEITREQAERIVFGGSDAE